MVTYIEHVYIHPILFCLRSLIFDTYISTRAHARTLTADNPPSCTIRRGALRRLYRASDGRRVTDISEIEDGDNYVVANEPFKAVSYATDILRHQVLPAQTRSCNHCDSNWMNCVFSRANTMYSWLSSHNSLVPVDDWVPLQPAMHGYILTTIHA